MLSGTRRSVLPNPLYRYQGRLDFQVDDAAPLVDPYPDAIGSLDTISDTGNNLSVSNARLQIAASVANANPRAYIRNNDGGLSYVRSSGVALFFLYNRLTGTLAVDIGWYIATSDRPLTNAVLMNGSAVQARISGILADLSFSMNTNTDYRFAIILRSSGCFIFIKGGAATAWRLLFVSTANNTSAMFAGIGTNSTATSAVQADNFSVVLLPVPFKSDYGIAIVNVTNFTQSLGSELLTNGDFSSWSGDNPTGWTVSGEVLLDPAVTQSGNAARFISTLTNNAPTIQQNNVLTVGNLYEMEAIISARTNGSLGLQLGTGLVISANAVQTYTTTRRATTNGTVFALGLTAPTDITIDNYSVKLVTLNVQQVAVADGIFDFEFTLPGSPVAGQRCELRYRVVDTLNYWVMYIRRNSSNSAWDFLLDSVVAGVETNRASASGIGTPKRMQVRAIGDLHNCYTFDTSEVPTKRGGEINNSTHNTATGLNTVYSSAVTPVRLTAYQIENTALYDRLFDRIMV